MVKRESNPQSISWERVRAIFGNAPIPRVVRECQFDYFNDDLQRIATTPYRDINFDDLWYYHHDLAYVELQEDLFDYLFPVCLMDWHETLQRNQTCSHGDSEFHYGVHHGKVFEKMMNEAQRQAVWEFFRDCFIRRLHDERGFNCVGGHAPAHAWIMRFNSLGIVMPRIDILWNAWWSLETPGQAVAALEYLSGFMYSEGENKLFAAWTPEAGGGGPYLWQSDALIHSHGWMPENLSFLRSRLTIDFVNEQVAAAVQRLESEPEAPRAACLFHDLPHCQELIRERVAQLPNLLVSANNDGWMV